MRETFNDKIIKNKKFIFEYCTTSKKNSLRGFHFQYKFQQAKCINVLKGKILDCVVDLRKNLKLLENILKLFFLKKTVLVYMSLRDLRTHILVMKKQI